MKLIVDPESGTRCLVAEEELDLYAQWSVLDDSEADALQMRIAKDAARAIVNRARDQLQAGTAPTPIAGKRVDADEASKVKINGLVSMAMLAKTTGSPFAVDFTFADNGEVTLSADEMIAVGLAVGAHVINCHERAKLLKKTIELSTSLAELETLDLAAGWP